MDTETYYQILLEVVGDDGPILSLCLDNINDREESIEFAKDIADQIYLLTGIEPMNVTGQ